MSFFLDDGKEVGPVPLRHHFSVSPFFSAFDTGAVETRCESKKARRIHFLKREVESALSRRFVENLAASIADGAPMAFFFSLSSSPASLASRFY